MQGREREGWQEEGEGNSYLEWHQEKNIPNSHLWGACSMRANLPPGFFLLRQVKRQNIQRKGWESRGHGWWQSKRYRRHSGKRLRASREIMPKSIGNRFRSNSWLKRLSNCPGSLHLHHYRLIQTCHPSRTWATEKDTSSHIYSSISTTGSPNYKQNNHKTNHLQHQR